MSELVDTSYGPAKPISIVGLVDLGGRVLFCTDGTVRIEHACHRRDIDQTIIVAPRLQLAEGGHRIVTELPLTVDPSILCPDCGLHGYIRSGRWVPA